MQPKVNKPNGVGVRRIIHATRCSIKGCKAAWQFESAFRQELLLCACLLPLSVVLAESTSHWVLLVCSMVFVLFAEVINSAIEAVCDAVTLDNHPLIGRAKDLGSFAVMLSLILMGIIWIEAAISFSLHFINE